MQSPDRPATKPSRSLPVTAQPVIDYATNGVDNIVDPSRPGLCSLIFGALFFVPVVLQLYAIAMGLISLRQSKCVDRAFGIAGLILGSAALIWWIYFAVRMSHGH